MLRLSLATCPRFDIFYTAQKGDELTAMHFSEATTPIQKITLLLKDKVELYQGIEAKRSYT